ncbi:hypothetical protein BJX62DRAFT_232242 [Aspergillus germanicus]
MASAFESLPFELLFEITGWLAVELVNRFCCSMANRHRFRNIHFTVTTARRLVYDIDQWNRILNRCQVYPYVRRLSVHLATSGQGPAPESDNAQSADNTDGDGDEAYWEERKADKYRQLVADEHEWNFSGSLYQDLVATRDVIITYPPASPAVTCKADGWKPLADFLHTLVGLEDLFWFTRAQFPECMLQVLHRDLPQCHLHLKVFQLQGDLSEDGYVSDSEFTLATSPCLSSIVVSLLLEHDVLMHQAIGELASGAAPNLTELYILYETPPPVYQGQNTQSYSPRVRFSQSRLKALSKVRLLGLSNSSLEGSETNELEIWSRYIPFQNLRVLQLHGFGDPHVLENAHLFEFPSLEALSLDFNINRVDIEDREGTVRRMDNAARAFLLSSLPLRSLALSSTFAERALESAISHHGHALERLNLCPQYSADSWRWVITPELLHEISRAYPNLHTLYLQIQRTQRDIIETNIYKALALLPLLKQLIIELDCARRSHDNPFGSQSLRDFLINIAIDEALIRSIVSIILKKSPSIPLQSLKVIPRVSGRCDISLRQLTSAMHKMWELKRFSYNGNFTVTKESLFDECFGVPPPERFIEPVFHELWPARGKDWTQDWHSLPIRWRLIENESG